jgi:hypothetical protein
VAIPVQPASLSDYADFWSEVEVHIHARTDDARDWIEVRIETPEFASNPQSRISATNGRGNLSKRRSRGQKKGKNQNFLEHVFTLSEIKMP